MKALKPFWILLAIFVAMVGIALVKPMVEGKGPIAWQTDYRAATVEAQKVKKPMFLYFTATWCDTCQSLEDTTWRDREMEKTLEGYVPVKIDVDDNPELLQQYKIEDGVPDFVVVGADGTTVRKYDGVIRTKELLEWMNQKGS